MRNAVILKHGTIQALNGPRLIHQHSDEISRLSEKKLIYLVLFSLYLGLKFEIRERNLELLWASFGSGRILLIYFFNLINNK